MQALEALPNETQGHQGGDEDDPPVSPSQALPPSPAIPPPPSPPLPPTPSTPSALVPQQAAATSPQSEQSEQAAYAAALADRDRVASRVGAALASCGNAILLSSVSNAIAFALGARSPLPALHGFCTYAAVGMIFDFGFQVTFFVAAVALDERRRLTGLSIWPCIPITSCPRVLRPSDEASGGAGGALGSRLATTYAAKTPEATSAPSPHIITSSTSSSSSSSTTTTSATFEQQKAALLEVYELGGLTQQEYTVELEKLLATTELGDANFGAKVDASSDAPAAIVVALPASVPTAPHIAKHSSALLPLLKVCVLLTYATTLGLSILASNDLSVGLQVASLVPSSAPVAQFLAAQQRLFATAPTLVEVVVQHRQPAQPGRGGGVGAEMGSETSRASLGLSGGGFATLRRLRGALYATDAVHTRAYDGQKAVSPLWLNFFDGMLAASGAPSAEDLSPSQVEAQLDGFMTTGDSALLTSAGGMIVRESGGGSAVDGGWDSAGDDGGGAGIATALATNATLLATSMRLLIDGYGPAAMVRLRATLARVGVGGSAFAFSANDIYYEQDAIMLEYAHQSLLSVLVAVLGAVLLLTMRLDTVVLMGACTLSCIAHLLGWMKVVGISLSSISLVPLLLAVGLCIDYCTHIAHAHAEAEGSAHERTLAALRTRGAAVLNSGISTGLSVLLLAFGNSAIFTTFFWMLLGVVVVGLSHALLVLPACLSLLGGAAAREVAGERDGEASKSVVASPTRARISAPTSPSAGVRT